MKLHNYNECFCTHTAQARLTRWCATETFCQYVVCKRECLFLSHIFIRSLSTNNYYNEASGLLSILPRSKSFWFSNDTSFDLYRTSFKPAMKFPFSLFFLSLLHTLHTSFLFSTCVLLVVPVIQCSISTSTEDRSSGLLRSWSARGLTRFSAQPYETPSALLMQDNGLNFDLNTVVYRLDLQFSLQWL